MRKTVNIEGLEDPIVLSRRKGTRSVKLSISSEGVVKLSVPYGMPEFLAKKFASDRIEWILEHRKQPQIITTGTHIGKSHTLKVENSDISRPSTKLNGMDIRVRLPLGVDPLSKAAQATVHKACEKALLLEAKNLLPQRLQHLSQTYSIPYKSVSVKKLKSRWGACDNHNNISLNSYLIQLDWALIDYVICHELAHTIHHNHSLQFWGLVEKILPDYKALKKQLKSKSTAIFPT